MEPSLQSLLEEVNDLYGKNCSLFKKIEEMEEFNRLEIFIENGGVSDIKKCKIEKDEWKGRKCDIKGILYPNIYNGIDNIKAVEGPANVSISQMLLDTAKMYKTLKNLKTALNEQALAKYICTILPYWRNANSILEKEYETMNMLNSVNAVEAAQFLFSSFGNNYTIGYPCEMCKTRVAASNSLKSCSSCRRSLALIPSQNVPKPIVPKRDTELDLIKLSVEMLRTKCKIRGVKLNWSDRKNDIIKKLLDSQK